MHATDWIWLGDSPDGVSSWFIRGEKPKQVRVEIQRGKLAEFVTLQIEWFNLSVPGEVYRGRELFQIPVGDDVTRESVEGATTAGVVRCLEILKEVVTGTGVAGRDAVESTRKSEKQ